MRFLYTGAKEFMLDQTDPDNSLGGFCSKSPVPNRINNLFSDVSYLSIFNENEECRAIVIENNSSNAINDVKIGYKYDKSLYDIQIAVVELNQDGNMERISNSRDIPYYAEFIEADITDTEDNSMELDFEANKRYGIWVKRKILPQRTKSCVDLNNQTTTPLETIDFEFIIKYEE